MLGQKATKVGRQATAVQGDLSVFNKGQYDESGIGNGPFDDISALVDPATNLLITPAQDGTDATGVTPPAGGIGIRGWLSGIFATLTARLPALNNGRMPVDIGADDITLSLPAGLAQDTSVQQLVTALGTVADAAAAAGNGSIVALLKQMRAQLGGSLTANLGTLNGAALDTSVQQAVTALGSILTTLQAQRSDTLWTDDTGAYFVRSDAGGTIAWYTTSGAASAAPGTGARPAAGTTVLLSRSPFQATAAGAGFSIGDYIDHFVTTDPSSGAVIGNFWVDLTTGAKLASAPASASITPVAPLPTNASTQTGQTTGNASLASILAALQGALSVATGQSATAGDTVIQGQTSGAAISAGGTGYVAGDVSKTITLTDGTVLTIGAVSGGAVTAVTVTTAGSASTPSATGVVASGTTATGTGATFNLTYASVATTLFGGTAPVNGWKIANPDPSNDLWANDNGTPALNNGFRVFAAGGEYNTQPGERPVGVLKVWGPVVGQVVKARRW